MKQVDVVLVFVLQCIVYQKVDTLAFCVNSVGFMQVNTL